MKKKIMCLALSLAFGVMSSQAQAIGNSTQILAEIDSTILKFRDLRGFGWRSQPRSIVFHPYYVKNSEDFNIYISYVKSLLLSNQRWTPYAILGTIEHTKKIIEEKKFVGDESIWLVAANCNCYRREIYTRRDANFRTVDFR
jgi:hypothetical protein